MAGIWGWFLGGGYSSLRNPGSRAYSPEANTSAIMLSHELPMCTISRLYHTPAAGRNTRRGLCAERSKKKNRPRGRIFSGRLSYLQSLQALEFLLPLQSFCLGADCLPLSTADSALLFALRLVFSIVHSFGGLPRWGCRPFDDSMARPRPFYTLLFHTLFTPSRPSPRTRFSCFCGVFLC